MCRPLQRKAKKAIFGKADRSPLYDHRRVGEEKALALVAPAHHGGANRHNSEIKNRRNLQEIKHIAFSNRHKIGLFRLPYFRPAATDSVRGAA